METQLRLLRNVLKLFLIIYVPLTVINFIRLAPDGIFNVVFGIGDRHLVNVVPRFWSAQENLAMIAVMVSLPVCIASAFLVKHPEAPTPKNKE